MICGIMYSNTPLFAHARRKFSNNRYTFLGERYLSFAIFLEYFRTCIALTNKCKNLRKLN